MRKADLLANHAVSSLPLLILYKIWFFPKFLRKNVPLLVRNCFLQLHGRNEVQINQVSYFMGFPGVPSVCSAAQSCPTLCDPMDCSPPGSSVHGILQARTLEGVAISFSNAWEWSRSVVSDSLWPHGLQSTRLLRPWDFPGKSTGVGCYHLLQ